jgi:hypothetical protein
VSQGNAPEVIVAAGILGCADPDLVRRFDPRRFADFDPFSPGLQGRCAAARAAKLSG